MDEEGIGRGVVGSVDCNIERDMRVDGATLDMEVGRQAGLEMPLSSKQKRS